MRAVEKEPGHPMFRFAAGDQKPVNVGLEKGTKFAPHYHFCLANNAEMSFPRHKEGSAFAGS